MAWQPYFLKKEKADKKNISDITTIVFSVLGFLWILLFLWSDNIIRIRFGNFTFFGEQYWAATDNVPIIGLAYVFHACYLIQLPGIYHLEKTGLISWVRGIGAIVNIILNFLFIPKYGIMGAASGTCFSFMLMAAILYFINKRIFPISYNWNRLGMIFATAGFIYFIQFNLTLDLSMRILVSISYPIIMIFTGIINLNQIRNIITKLLNAPQFTIK